MMRSYEGYMRVTCVAYEGYIILADNAIKPFVVLYLTIYLLI